MKRSFLTVLATASVFALGACGGDAEDTDIEPIEEIEPAPAPAPAPVPMDTMTMGDTLVADTTMTTTGL